MYIILQQRKNWYSEPEDLHIANLAAFDYDASQVFSVTSFETTSKHSTCDEDRVLYSEIVVVDHEDQGDAKTESDGEEAKAESEEEEEDVKADKEKESENEDTESTKVVIFVEGILFGTTHSQSEV